ncbi:16S rRNA (adenine(1518)-N(6)/adenine(1519)-N(6))-dimethyltransferase RsmA [Tardisphaera miroshnichenkoae]
MRAGQNFLINQEYAEMELEALNPSGDETVLEIGSGDGRITRLIAERAKRVIAIEKDEVLMAVAKATSVSNVEWVLGDALRLDFPEVDLVFSNVPYYISSPLILKLVKWGKFKRAVLSLQKEFAARLISPPGSREYGRISVIFQLLAAGRPLFYIPPWAFNPEPKVWSTVIEVRPEPKVTPGELPRLEKFTAALFSQKNRLLPKSLCKLGLCNSQKEAISMIGDRDLAKKRVRELTPSEVLSLSFKFNGRLN